LRKTSGITEKSAGHFYPMAAIISEILSGFPSLGLYRGGFSTEVPELLEHVAFIYWPNASQVPAAPSSVQYTTTEINDMSS